MVPKVDTTIRMTREQKRDMKQQLGNMAAVALGGAVGSLGRYSVAMLAERLLRADFPMGTLLANLGGCLVIGISWSLFDRIHISHDFRLFLFTGLLGGFTTFSTYAREAVQFLKTGDLAHGLSYILISNIAGLAVVAAGFLLGERLLRL